MEELHILDVGYDAQLWALHYVFLPRVQRNLDTFIQQWNSHGLTSEHGNSPYQLFTSGILESHGSQYTGVQAFMEDGRQEQEGADAEREDENSDTHDYIQRPALSMIQCPLTQNQLTELQGRVSPIDDGDSIGIETYKQVVIFCG